MSRHAATRGPSAATTIIALAALLAGLTAGIPAALYALTRDWAVTGRTVLLAAVVVAIDQDGFAMAWVVRELFRPYRGRR